MRYLQFFIYFVCIAFGFAARRSGQLSAAQTARLSWWVGWVIYPAMAFSAITATFTKATLLSHWTLPVAELAIMLFGALCAWVILRFYPCKSERAAGTVGFNLAIGNYVFLPLPLAVFLWGPTAAANVIVASLGAEVAFWTVGVAFLSRGQFRWRKFFTPAVISLLFGFLVVLSDHEGVLDAAAGANVVLGRVGAFTIPVAMFLLGYHLAGAVGSRWLEKEVILVTLFRGVVVPAAFLLGLPWFGLSTDAARTLFLIAVMPVAVASVYMSDLFHGDPELAAKCVVVGHVFSLASIPFWLWLF